MKYLIIFLFCLIALGACKKKEERIAEKMMLTADTSAVLKFSADFLGSADVITSGKAEVYFKNNSFTLRLTNFKTNAGPDLHVLLSKEQMPANYMDLGALQKLKGDQEYAIQGMPNFNDYSYICIHCIQYNHLFGTAKLK